ncbi:MAG: DUF4743 domain-containing protein [Alphaproteobacteria bacterium]
MSFLQHIERCNRHDLNGFLPVHIGPEAVGWARPAVTEILVERAQAFDLANGALHLRPTIGTFEDRSMALNDCAHALVEAGFTSRLLGEQYRVAESWLDTPLATVDRGVIAAFGFPAYGVHVNGWRPGANGEPNLWIGHRALDKPVEPGKLDNMVAGGQPHGLTLLENVIKEADEEASVPAALARQARPVSCLTYRMETPKGLRPDVLFCYDLKVPDDFTPVNTDGETAEFSLMPVRQIADIVRSTDRFKFNVNLVVIDFLVRHGLINADEEPDYTAIIRGLHS